MLDENVCEQQWISEAEPERGIAEIWRPGKLVPVWIIVTAKPFSASPWETMT
jgi:hypothetical protein